MRKTLSHPAAVHRDKLKQKSLEGSAGSKVTPESGSGTGSSTGASPPPPADTLAEPSSGGSVGVFKSMKYSKSSKSKTTHLVAPGSGSSAAGSSVSTGGSPVHGSQFHSMHGAHTGPGVGGPVIHSELAGRHPDVIQASGGGSGGNSPYRKISAYTPSSPTSGSSAARKYSCPNSEGRVQESSGAPGSGGSGPRVVIPPPGSISLGKSSGSASVTSSPPPKSGGKDHKKSSFFEGFRATLRQKSGRSDKKDKDKDKKKSASGSATPSLGPPTPSGPTTGSHSSSDVELKVECGGGSSSGRTSPSALASAGIHHLSLDSNSGHHVNQGAGDSGLPPTSPCSASSSKKSSTARAISSKGVAVFSSVISSVKSSTTSTSSSKDTLDTSGSASGGSDSGSTPRRWSESGGRLSKKKS